MQESLVKGRKGDELRTDLLEPDASRIIVHRFRLIAGTHKVYQKVQIADIETGLVVASSDEKDVGTDAAVKPYFLSAKKSRHDVSLYLNEDASAGRSSIILSKVMAEGGNDTPASSVIMMFVHKDPFVGPLYYTGEALGESGEVVLTDENSVVLMPLKYPLADGTFARVSKTQIETKSATVDETERGGMFHGKDYRGVSVLGAYRHITVNPEVSWKMVVKVDRAEVLVQLWRRVLVTVILSLVGLSAAGGLATLIATRISRPIERLSQVAQVVTSGDLSARARVAGSKEVEVLSATFNSMIERIQIWHQALDEQVSDLSVLHNVSRALASTVNLDELLSIVIDEVNKALLAEGAGVLLYDEHRGDLYWRRVRDAGRILAPQSEALRLPLDCSIAGWVFRNNEPARVNDTSKDPRYYPEMSRRSGFEIRKVLQVPLNSRERTIGVLMVMNKIGGDFSNADELLLTSMASSIALAIDNATVYEKLRESRDHLEMVYRSSMALAGTTDLDHLLRVVLGELKTALDTEAAGVLLHDEVQGDLYWREVIGDKGLIDRRTKEIRLPLDGTVSGKVFQSGEPMLVNDPTASPLFTPFKTITSAVVHNMIIVPLHTREKTIGVLVVMNRREGRFVDYDVQILSSLAGVVALAVENATFFKAMLESYRDMEELNRVKSKILNHLSHELRTPLAIINGTVVTMWRKLKDQGNQSFDRGLQRIARHLQSLNRLEAQVESIMMTGYTWERRYVTEFLRGALELMDLQAEYTPEIRKTAAIIHQWLETTFPTRQDAPERINAKEFGDTIFAEIREKAQEARRRIVLDFDLEPNADLMMPRHVLRAIMEGFIRNAIEATPDDGRIDVTGSVKGDRYLLVVKDTGIGIPEREKEFIFQGFYPAQETEDYCSKHPYSFNAGGKGIDLLRIKMFSELYAFQLTFTSRRCPKLQGLSNGKPGDTPRCEDCTSTESCEDFGGSEFIVNFPLADSKAAQDLIHDEKWIQDWASEDVFERG